MNKCNSKIIGVREQEHYLAVAFDGFAGADGAVITMKRMRKIMSMSSTRAVISRVIFGYLETKPDE